MKRSDESNRGEMDLHTSEDVSVMDRARTQAQVLLPLARALRAEIGEERTREIMRDAIHESIRTRVRAQAEKLTGTPREKFQAMMRNSAEDNGPMLDLEMLDLSPETIRFDVKSCMYADLFKSLGETELGAMLLCDSDAYVAKIGAPDVAFERSQTIMQGATHCDFCYRIKTGDE
jgi:hypothetical protein